MKRPAYGFLALVAAVAFLSLAVGIVSADITTRSITYQGKLTDASGDPVSGVYAVYFSLYDVASGGTALATDSQKIDVADGLFTTDVEFDEKFFDGRTLWIGVTFEGEKEMSPRQAVRPVPYALSLRPGARINGTSDSPVLNVTNNGFGPAIRGASTEDVGVYGKGYTAGGEFTGTLVGIDVSSTNKGIVVNTSGGKNHGIYSSNYGDQSEGIEVVAFGKSSQAISTLTNASGSIGILSRAYGINSDAIYAETSQISSDAIYVLTYGNDSEGIYLQTQGGSSDGVYSWTTGPSSKAVVGISTQDTGVSGTGKEGGAFSTNAAGTIAKLRPGINATTSYEYNPGVMVTTGGIGSEGALVTTKGDGSHGIHSETHGMSSAGVYIGTYGNNSPGVSVITFNNSSTGVAVLSQKSRAIWADTGLADHKYGVQTPDYIRALGYETGSSDVAEYMPVTGDLSPGTVLIIGEDGTLKPSSSAYDTRVAGIVSTDPGVFLGAKEDGNPGEEMIAISGRVPCKVDASYGAIHAGDLLTTSDTPGYAMKAVPTEIGGRGFYPDGTILGKAMGDLENGAGTIEVLVTLQ